jgi:pimeloyl-ACP methyl ester carboxylesterase
MNRSPDRVVALPDGRRLCVAEYGDARGIPVLAFHGLPGSRRQHHPDDSIAASLGVRMLHLDRPGFGQSDPQRSRTLTSWAADVCDVCDALGLDRVRVIAASAGGPYALACAATLGERIVRSAVVSGIGPPGTMAFRSQILRVAFALATKLPWSVRPFASGARLLARHAPARYVDAVAGRLNPADRRTLARPEIRAMFVEDLHEAFAQGSAACSQDLALVAAPWPFELSGIQSPLVLWHGEEDLMIPHTGAEAIARAVSSATLHLVPGAGHFMALEHWSEILSALVA